MRNSGISMPQGIGVRIEVAAVVLGVAAMIVVSLRLWVRLGNGAIGRDDYLMVIALVSLQLFYH